MTARHFRLFVFDGKHDILAALDLVAGNVAVAVWRARIELNTQRRGKIYELWQVERPRGGGLLARVWRLSASEDKLAIRRDSQAQ